MSATVKRAALERTWRGILACALGQASLGCSFLLDFDELKGEASTETESDPAGGTEESDPAETDPLPGSDETDSETDETDVAGEPDAAPSDASDANIACDAGCDDDDPCTIDRCAGGSCVHDPVQCVASDACMEALCVEGECVETPRVGVVHDGLDQTDVADAIYRSELVSAGDRFYRATYGTWDGKPDVRVSSFGAATTASMSEYRYTDALPSNVEVISPAALAADTRFGLSLHVYVAVRVVGQDDRAPGSLARVRLTRDLTPIGGSGATLVTTAPNYRFVSNRLGPAAGQTPGAEPYVVWGGCTTVGTGSDVSCVSTEATGGAGGLYFQSGDTGLDPSTPGDDFIPESGILSGLAAITSGSLPGAVWMTNLAPSGVDVSLGFTDGGTPRHLVQCDTLSGFAGYGLNASASLGNLWTASWSKRMGSSFRTELVALQCQNDTCLDTLVQPPDACPVTLPVGRVQPDTRSLVARSLDRPGDAAEQVYQTFAHAASVGGRARLSLIVNRLDFANEINASPDASTRRPSNLGELELASSPPESAPDWPALATLPPDKLAVSWIEPDADSRGDRLRVQRYRICYGD